MVVMLETSHASTAPYVAVAVDSSDTHAFIAAATLLSDKRVNVGSGVGSRVGSDDGRVVGSDDGFNVGAGVTVGTGVVGPGVGTGVGQVVRAGTKLTPQELLEHPEPVNAFVCVIEDNTHHPRSWLNDEAE